MLAGWLRVTRPDVVHAAVASSAPVQVGASPALTLALTLSLTLTRAGGGKPGSNPSPNPDPDPNPCRWGKPGLHPLPASPLQGPGLHPGLASLYSPYTFPVRPLYTSLTPATSR